MRHIIAVLALYLLPGIPLAAAADSLAVYSNVCINKDSGDLNGIRIVVLRLGDASYLAMQQASGISFEEMDLKKISPDELSKGKISFPYEYQKRSAPFSGTISEKAITGTFDDKSFMKDYGWKTIQLRRVSPSQKTYGDCR